MVPPRPVAELRATIAAAVDGRRMDAAEIAGDLQLSPSLGRPLDSVAVAVAAAQT